MKIRPDRIREARKRAGLSQEILSLRVCHNASHAVSLWESGKMGVAKQHVPGLCAALGVTEAMLSGAEEIPGISPDVSYGLELLRKTRKRLELPLTQLAPMIGVSASRLGEWERGSRKIPTYAMERLAKALGLEMANLVKPEPVPNPTLDWERKERDRRLKAEPGRFSRLGCRSPYTRPAYL